MTGDHFSDKKAGYKNKLVSAIITTHDREPEMVLRAVNSVLRQTYQSMELIVVDDSSPSFPRRTEVERSVRSISDSILYLKHDSCQGACAARNTGLQHARGYYVGFLDDDDEWMPTKIEEQLKGFCDDDTALVYSRAIIIDDAMNRTYIDNYRGENGHVFETLLKGNFIGSTSNPLIKKTCIEEVGDFDVLMRSRQDYDLWLRLALRYPIRFVDAPLLRYHVHPGERISADAEKKIQGCERILMKYAPYIDKDKEAWYVLHRRLIPYYLRQYGRRKALVLFISCVRKCPDYFSKNLRLLVRIILGNDLYMSIRGRLCRKQ